MIQISRVHLEFEREALRARLGFKGRYLSELWQVVAGLDDASGIRGLGLGTQSVLWADAKVFSRQPEAAANAQMFQVTAHALSLCEGREFADPGTLFDTILPSALAQAQLVTGNPDLRPTFVLNALVPVDNAAWQLHAVHHGGSFDAILPPDQRAALASRHTWLAGIPLVSYQTSVPEAVALVQRGHFILKIKLGHDPDGDGDRAKMLAWDCRRLDELHAALRDCRTMHTDHGGIAYYLDANGRYDSLNRVHRLLDHCRKIGALDHIILLEEPLPEEMQVDVRELPVRIAADESAHSVEDVRARLDAGYGAIALKPIAKTLSLSLRMAAEAHARGVPCFCADLTVNPILVDWNKVIAARLAPLPGLKLGVFETNGAQYYRDWLGLCAHHPRPAATWIEPHDGFYTLDDTFYQSTGGIWEQSPHYASLLPRE